MCILDKPEMHEKGMNKMSMSTRTNKIASALLLLKKDPLMTLKLLGYWVATVVFALLLLVAAGGELFLKPGGSIDFVTLADGRKIGGGDGIPGAVVVGAK